MNSNRPPGRVITFGTFDLFHIGHLRVLERAAALGDHLTVGVSSDAFNFQKKNRLPFVPQEDRRAIVAALRCVDDTFIEESMELKEQYIREVRASVLVMGDDWRGKFDHLSHMCKVEYLPRTASVSTTEIESLIRTRPSPTAQIRAEQGA